jgi:hypothetical protein
VVIDATNIEAIAYNIASTAQIQPSMSEPVDVSLPLPSSDPLLMKDNKTAAVPTVVIDATNIEAIAYNIASTAQIQHSMSEAIDVSPSVSRVRIDANTTRKRPIAVSGTAGAPNKWRAGGIYHWRTKYVLR